MHSNNVYCVHPESNMTAMEMEDDAGSSQVTERSWTPWAMYFRRRGISLSARIQAGYQRRHGAHFSLPSSLMIT